MRVLSKVFFWGNQMHYYQFNIGDYGSHTKHLTPCEDICYRRLLDFYYLHEAPIPHDLVKITRLLCLNKEYISDVETVLNEFFIFTEDGWINERADKEIKQYQSFKTAGAAGAAKRWATVNNTPPNTPPKQPPIPTINHKPLTIKHKPLKPYTSIGQKSALDGFESFWEIYPKKVGKGAARKSWEKSRPTLSTVLLALQWQIDSAQWRKNNGQFIPNPTTYLNQERWQDSPDKEVLF